MDDLAERFKFVFDHIEYYLNLLSENFLKIRFVIDSISKSKLNFYNNLKFTFHLRSDFTYTIISNFNLS